MQVVFPPHLDTAIFLKVLLGIGVIFSELFIQIWAHVAVHLLHSLRHVGSVLYSRIHELKSNEDNW